MKTDYTHIEQLIELFFEGKTSNQQEEELYTFFRSENVPDSLLRFKPVFDYFDMTLAEEVPEEVFVPEKKKIVKPFISTFWKLVGGVAAVVCLFFVLKGYENASNTEFYLFEGSYIVRNGVKITEPVLIEPELKRTLEEAERLQRDIERLLNSIPSPPPHKDISPSYINVSDRIEEIIDSYTDEYVKEEVRRTLTSSL
ncbi:MAG: hypothetical protein LUG98_02710 [Tannerellaceae bacterium]|nr:hypothetical protein [Tannerellaceae bacterium]